MFVAIELSLTAYEGVIYASTATAKDTGFARLEEAVNTLLDGADVTPSVEVLWKMQYQQRTPTFPKSANPAGGVISLPEMSSGLVLSDSVLDEVRRAWRNIMAESDDQFMKFEERGGTGDEDDE